MSAQSLHKLLRSTNSSDAVEPIVRLWLLRILVCLEAHRNFIESQGFTNDGLAEVLGLGSWPDPSLDDFDPKRALVQLREMHADAERKCDRMPLPGYLRTNMERLSNLMGLDPVDCQILAFAVLIHNERILDDTADYLGIISTLKVVHALAVILALPEDAVRRALSPKSALLQSGLLALVLSGAGTLSCKLDLLSGDFADLMMSSEADPATLLSGTVSAVEPGHLALDDYPHIQNSLNVLMPYLRRVKVTGQRGVNIFMYGMPGTGKSQLARVVAGALDCELFEVAREDDNGDPINGQYRLRAFRAGQHFFASRPALMVFDEVEDVFDDGNALFGRKSTAQLRKSWMNRMLEENPMPTLWLSNTVDGLDPAFIRRFDMVFELPIPPKAQRKKIVRTYAKGLLDKQQVDRIAESSTLAPAVVAKASTVVHAIRDELNQYQAVDAFEHLVNNTLQAQGHEPLDRHDANRLPSVYDPNYVNADADLVYIADGLRHAQTGRLCLYGPPGTGKTAYARWLADQLDKPLVAKRASDLISKWVGDSEKNIARAFAEAERDGSVLLIDEVDSFLQDRRAARNSWEVTLVNEMLTRMEAFSGVFVASTNLMDGLDQAALRRFDLKVKFDCLRPNQAWDLLCRYCVDLGFAEPAACLQRRMQQLPQLTPGDFATVMRQHRFRPLESPVTLVTALAAECAVKEGSKMPIGFC